MTCRNSLRNNTDKRPLAIINFMVSLTPPPPPPYQSVTHSGLQDTISVIEKRDSRRISAVVQNEFARIRKTPKTFQLTKRPTLCVPSVGLTLNASRRQSFCVVYPFRQHVVIYISATRARNTIRSFSALTSYTNRIRYV